MLYINLRERSIEHNASTDYVHTHMLGPLVVVKGSNFYF